MLKIYQDERREKYMKVRERDLKSRQNRTSAETRPKCRIGKRERDRERKS